MIKTISAEKSAQLNKSRAAPWAATHRGGSHVASVTAAPLTTAVEPNQTRPRQILGLSLCSSIAHVPIKQGVLFCSSIIKLCFKQQPLGWSRQKAGNSKLRLMLRALLTQLLRLNKAQWCELGTGCYSPSPGSFLPCLVSSQSPNFHKSLCWFLALSFPQSRSQRFVPMVFLLGLVKSLCLPQHPLGTRVRVVMGVSGLPVAAGALWGRGGSAGDGESKAVTPSA